MRVSRYGKAYAVVISNERYEKLLSQGHSGLELFAGLERVDLEEGESSIPKFSHAR